MDIGMNKQDVINRVETSLDKIRPFLKTDGGDVKVIDVSSEGVLTLEFLGNCSACSMSNFTFKNGIEQTVISDVKEIKSIDVTNLTTATN